ncbi:MAG TPA: GTP-binding protein [Planctomycetota bacterium]|nr:GTP-binding protein [Planctomycetota bacterium]HRR79887.1 GTP-binding protein [Planctomycetota bacterium]HRT95513.1 GTP-binding protein [Planctomycetota bacterium]
MPNDRLKVAFLGHVDHGKSTLIGRLLYDTASVPPDQLEQLQSDSAARGLDTEFAFLLDHLREERDDAMTLDTAQAFFYAGDREYVAIDAPGHRELLRNMLTGAWEAQAAVLVVDAQEGPDDQTRRHAFLLSLLGIARCLVAVNKMDLVGFAAEPFEAARGQALALVARVGVTPAAAVPISARQGDNVAIPSDRMPWYRGPTVLEALDGLPGAHAAERPMRFCVQDVYNFDGRRYIAGRVESGTLEAGGRVLLLPQHAEAQVLTIERFMSDRAAAEAGESIAVTLPDELAVQRGQVLCAPNRPPRLARSLTARLFWLAPRPLERGASLTLRLSTQETPCRVTAIARRTDSSSLDILEQEARELAAAEVADVSLETPTALVVEPASENPAFGRLVLESDAQIVGAGLVVEAR